MLELQQLVLLMLVLPVPAPPTLEPLPLPLLMLEPPPPPLPPPPMCDWMAASFAGGTPCEAGALSCFELRVSYRVGRGEVKAQ